MTESIDLSRRTLLQVAAAATAVTAGGAHAQNTQEKTTVPANPVFESTSVLKPLSFDPTKLPGLSERLLRSHWENNYGGSVKALAAVKKHLAEAMGNKDLPAYIYNDLKREHLLRTGSVVFHEYYFDNLGGSGKAGAKERQVIGDAFGTFNQWET